MVDLSIKNKEDEAICERVQGLTADMQTRMFKWAEINTGSWNREGLDTLAPILGDAYSALNAPDDLLGFERERQKAD